MYHKPFMVKFSDECEWYRGFTPNIKGDLVWYTDGSKTNKGTDAGVHREDLRRKHSFNLGLYTTELMHVQWKTKERAT
jgi:hypothetical protein